MGDIFEEEQAQRAVQVKEGVGSWDTAFTDDLGGRNAPRPPPPEMLYGGKVKTEMERLTRPERAPEGEEPATLTIPVHRSRYMHHSRKAAPLGVNFADPADNRERTLADASPSHPSEDVSVVEDEKPNIAEAKFQSAVEIFE